MPEYTFEIYGDFKPMIYLDGKPYLDTHLTFSRYEEAAAWAQNEIVRLRSLTPAPAAPAQQSERILTKWGFRSRFRFSERVAIYDAAKADTGVQVIIDDLFTLENLDLDDPAVAASLDYLVGLGLLTSERKTQVLE
ncbi:MAG: hypothetical protein K8I29_19420 [Alphaproteobacteria bacterium]|uniref:Uncharacterized protein n=1 Tax=Candidatus Nitrobium versatile TaxID=2884831 RepID=A0A953M3M1_9BACT|nr:hypothetical protein [Candidatus Nitrobium versatile]